MGHKTYMLCESRTGYVYNLEVYTGKSNNDASYINDPDIGATGNVVFRLVHGLEIRVLQSTWTGSIRHRFCTSFSAIMASMHVAQL